MQLTEKAFGYYVNFRINKDRMAFVWYSTPVARTITFCSDKTAVAIYPVDDKYARI